MLEIVEARRNVRVEERYDLLSGLLDAVRDESDNGAALSDEELIGKYSKLVHPGHLPIRHPRKHVHISSRWT